MNGDDSDDTGEQRPLVEPLSERKIEILQLIADNLNKREIAEKLSLAYSTVKWYTQQSYQKLGVHSRRQAVLRARELGLLAGEQAVPRAPVSLLAQLTPFIGRQAELEQICHLLGSPDCRLLTLLGPGGIGKTRLAYRVAESLIREAQAAFADGVYFVSLAGLSETKSIVPMVAGQLGFSFYDRKETPETQLLNYLRSKQVLLILDNFEHLINQDSQKFLKTTLRLCPRIRLLVTSRSRLNLPGEHIFPTTGLENPDPKALSSSQTPESLALSYSSVQLFRQSARRLMPDFKLSMQNLHPVGQICRHLEGMPLGIELAATWIRVLDPAGILAELEKSLIFLETDGDRSPGQELDLRSVFLVSWKLLAKGEQLAIQKLSVFRGSFSREMAQEVAQVSLKVLLSLADQSWLQRNTQGRFQIHELLRQYAWEQLKEDPQLWQKTCDDYSAYFCNLLSGCAKDWHTHKQLEALEKVRMEIQKLEIAWHWKVNQGDWLGMKEVLSSLCRYYEWTGNFQDGELACQTIAQSLSKGAGEQEKASWENGELLAYTWAWQSRFSEDQEEALQLLAQSQALLIHMPAGGQEVLDLQAFISYTLGERQWHDDRDAARQNFLHSLENYVSLKDDWGVAKASQNLGDIAWRVGDYEEASKLLSHSIEIYERLGDRQEAALSMDTLALVAKHIGKLREAEQMQRQALAIHEELGAAVNAVILMTDLAHTLVVLGKLDEAISLASQGLSQIEDLGFSIPSKAVALGAIARAYLHQGKYSKVSEYARAQLAAGKKTNYLLGVAGAHLNRGMAAIAEQAYSEAIQQLEKSYSILKQIHSVVTPPLAGLGLVYLKLQQENLARNYLLLSLKESLKVHAYSSLWYSLPGLALLFAVHGRLNLALELYLLGLKQPVFANSRWYKDVTEEMIASIGPVSPEENIIEPEEQVLSPDFWTMMEKIQLELEK